MKRNHERRDGHGSNGRSAPAGPAKDVAEEQRATSAAAPQARKPQANASRRRRRKPFVL
jgi:hypothetical protein